MKVTFRHTNLIARDWLKLCDFYKKVFDCIEAPPKRSQSGNWLESGTNTKGAALEGMHLYLPGFESHSERPTLEIYSYSETEPKGSPASNRLGYGHIAFEVSDVKALFDFAIENGAKKYGEIVSREIEGVGTLTFTYILDPEDNIIEIQSWDRTH